MSEFPALSFLKAIEQNMSGGFTPEERLAEGRRIASNPRGVDRTARELDDLYKTLLSGDYLETLISAAESGLAKANKTSITSRSVPERGGATNVAKANNRGQIDKKQQEVDKMQTLFDVLSNIKSGSQKEAPPSGEAVADPKVEVSDEPAAPEEVKPAISESEEPVSDLVDRRLSENPSTEPKEAEPAPTEAVEEVEAEPEEDYTDEATGLFKNTHGTSFDNKSAMDREKLEKMKAVLANQGGLGGMTPNQFALQVYRNA